MTSSLSASGSAPACAVPDRRDAFGRPGVSVELSGWGRYPRRRTQLWSAHARADLSQVPRLRNYVARGAGRAYGDAAIGLDSTFAMRGLDRMRHFDPASGLATVEAGVLLAEVIETFLPRGWFVPAVPGTRFVTVGGMVAADTHGKNHQRSGGFGACVHSLLLLLPSGEALTCSPTENAELFGATIGGMGLTGIILEVTFRLMRVETGWIRQKAIVAPSLDATLRALAKAESEATYSVAWLDVPARRGRPVRGVVFIGDHALSADLPAGTPRAPAAPKARLSAPVDMPAGTLNPWSVGVFNELYYRKAALLGVGRLAPWDSYFFALDAIAEWNRIYGRAGFLQHQCVIPGAAGAEVVGEILDRVAEAGAAPFLAVLKTLGAGAGVLSFPMPGLTLALDFRTTPGLFGLLDELDRVVVAAGGRLYLAKDARQSADTFRAGYPQLPRFEALRRDIDAAGRLTSCLSARLAIQ